MKKILICVMLTAMLFSFCGCDDVAMQQSVKVDNETGGHKSNSSMFVVVEKADEWWVVYHKETKVMYIMSYGMQNSGTFTLLVDADGSPMLWSEEEGG